MIGITITETGEAAELDLIRVDFSPEVIVTEHPTEQGTAVTDHIQRRPLRFVAEVFVTASPISDTPQPFIVEDAIGFFERALGQTLTVRIDGEGTFSGVVLESFPHGRDGTAGRQFSLRFRAIRIASAVSVPIPPRQPAPVAAAGAPTEQDLGQQSTTPGTPTSALYLIREAVLGPMGPFDDAGTLVERLYSGGG